MTRPSPTPSVPEGPSFLDWEGTFPRLAKLYRRTRMTDPKNYFVRVLEHLHHRPVQETMALYERGLEQLAPDDFERLAKKCASAVRQPTPDRMYEHFFNLLDEMWGYLLLKYEGCNSVHFVEAAGGDHPEACAHQPTTGVALLEVKSLRESADQREEQSSNSRRRAGNGTLDRKEESKPGGLFYRIEALVNAEASRQLAYESPCGPATCRIFLVLVSDHRVLISSRNEQTLQAWARKRYAGSDP
jgi:hypothetical protein